MIKCEQCRDRLLDHVYGLVEGNDLRETLEHLSGCPECQGALLAVQAEQKLLACAARAITAVPEFTPPSDEPAIVPMSQASVANASGSVKRPLWRRAWVGWTIAAGLLVAASAAISTYRHTVNGYERALAQKRQEHREVVERFAALPATYAALQHAAIAEIRAAANPYLSVTGPTTLEPGAKAHLRIRAQHPEGTPRQVHSKRDFARVDLRVEVLDAASRQVTAATLRCDDNGQAALELNVGAARPNAKLHVIVDAKTASGTARVEQPMHVLAPTYVTRIDTNKLAYQFNDVLFFRALVLDRYTMRPPTEPIAMHVELVNPEGIAVRSLDMRTEAGGILPCEFAIDDQFAEGLYALKVRPLDPANTTVQSASRPLEIVRKIQVPDFRFDQYAYRAGDRVTGSYLGTQPLPKNATINAQAAPVTIPPSAPGLAGGGAYGASGGKSAAKKKGPLIAQQTQAFAIPLPPKLPAGATRVPLTLQFANGLTRTADIPLAPTSFTIDFFPEGGDLIAGLPNRVFYRVRSTAGQPFYGAGRVMLLSAGNSDIVDSTYKLGMGYLDFVPHPKETYTVNITTPTKIETVKNPFARLGMHSEGVVLQIADPGGEHAPKAVGKQGEPIQITLRQQGPTRKLLVVAQCRGQIVDQRWVDLGRKPIAVTLQPTQEAFGMIRVTAYEKGEDKVLQPVAERLVYRSAQARLNFGFELDRQHLRPGPVAATATARDENGRPAAAWLLASVVDERFQARPLGLSAYFCVLNEIHTGADLDNAECILHDSPEAGQIFERFLGTYGWRRFVLAPTGVAIKTEQPAIFTKEAAPADALQQQYEEKIVQVVTPIQKAGNDNRTELENQRTRLTDAVAAAANDLTAFQTNVQLAIRIGLGVLVIGLLGISLILMGVGLYRILGAQKPATPVFGGAFACLAICLGVVFAGNRLGPPSVADPVRDFAYGPPAGQVRASLNQQFALLPTVRPLASTPLAGAFALPADKQGAAKDGGTASPTVVSEQIARALAQRAPGEAFGTTANRGADGQNPRSENIALNRRFQAALAIGNPPARAKAAPSFTPRAAPLATPTKDKKLLDGAGREYSHQHVQNVLTDTLLWHPSLWLKDGQADVHFDIGDGNATYRVLLLGHDPHGRFGFYETRLDVLGR